MGGSKREAAGSKRSKALSLGRAAELLEGSNVHYGPGRVFHGLTTTLNLR